MTYGTRRFNAEFTRAVFRVASDVSEHIVRLLASCQAPKLEDHSWLAVHDCLFNIFTANPHAKSTIKIICEKGKYRGMGTMKIGITDEQQRVLWVGCG
jgi:hypothetical protein